MKQLPQVLFWLGLISIPFAWLVWYLGPQMEMVRPVRILAALLRGSVGAQLHSAGNADRSLSLVVVVRTGGVALTGGRPSCTFSRTLSTTSYSAFWSHACFWRQRKLCLAGVSSRRYSGVSKIRSPDWSEKHPRKFMW